jgi:hypothetical protein
MTRRHRCNVVAISLVLVWSVLGSSRPGSAQASAPGPLPPAAQAAFDKGIVAAGIPDYPLAIRYFEEARKAAPDA